MTRTFLALLLFLLVLPASTLGAAPLASEIDWIAMMPGVRVAEAKQSSSRCEIAYVLTQDGYATMEAIRLDLERRGWDCLDNDRSAGDLMTRTVEATRGLMKLRLSARQRVGSEGRMNLDLIVLKVPRGT